MDQYLYKHGDKPLDGYTIKRAAGRGGFGEVYYAISDAGREVALKAVQSYEKIELRGITQCMNLKSPYLVNIFDVKYNRYSKPFVIMEYVSGPSLREILDESPSGLGEHKAAFFLREIAKGLSYLHECGIVHRDLKPANIFYENGYVKIGDYGLSKAIKQGYCSNQTITVGTVHYMAPEIGAGNYDCSIDIYALGCMLFEMLTGSVPFFGNSPGEILMKHVASEPDLSGIDETFARVIRKALAKDPSQRYQTVQEMVEDAFGTEHIRNSVSQFRAEDLSIIAERVARKAQAQTPQPTPQPQAEPAPEPVQQRSTYQQEQAQPQSQPQTPEPTKYRSLADKINKYDRNSSGFRLFTAIVAMLIISLAYALLIGRRYMEYMGVPINDKIVMVFWLFSMQIAGMCSLIFSYKLTRNISDFTVKAFTRVSLAVLISSIPILPAVLADSSPAWMRMIWVTVFGFVALFWLERREWLSPLRKQRIELGNIFRVLGAVFLLGVISQILGFRFDNSVLLFSCLLVSGVVMAGQLLFPYIEPADREAFLADNSSYGVSPRQTRMSQGFVPQPGWVRHVWFSLSGLLVSIIALCIILAANMRYANDSEFAAGCAVLGVLPLTFSMIRVRRNRHYRSVSANLIKPLVLILALCLALVGFAGLLATQDDDFLTLVVPGMIIFWLCLCIPVGAYEFGARQLGLWDHGINQMTNRRSQPHWVRHIWLCVTGFFTALMILLFTVAGNTYGRESDYAITWALGLIVPLIWSLFMSSKTRRFRGVGANLVKPLILVISLYFSGVGFIGMGMTGDDEFLGAIIPGMIIFWVMLCIPVGSSRDGVDYSHDVADIDGSNGRGYQPPRAAENAARETGNRPAQAAAAGTGPAASVATEASYGQSAKPKPGPWKAAPFAANQRGVSEKKRLPAAILCALPLFSGVVGFPVFGIHRFYAGRVGSGILWFFTAGLLGIGQIIDFIMILTGSFTDANGRPITDWSDDDARKNARNFNAVNGNNANTAPGNNGQYDKEHMSDDIKNAVDSVVGTVRHAAASVRGTVSEMKKNVKPEDYFSRGKEKAPQVHTQPDGSTYMIYREPLRPGAALLRLIGGILLTVAFVLLTCKAISLPVILMSIPGLGDELTNEFGPAWSSLLARLLPSFGYALIAIGTIIVLLGSKHKGGAHLIRVCVGVILISFSITVFHDAFDTNQFNSIMQNSDSRRDVVAFADSFLSCFRSEPCVVSVIIGLAGTIIFAWPAKRQQPQLIGQEKM